MFRKISIVAFSFIVFFFSFSFIRAQDDFVQPIFNQHWILKDNNGAMPLNQIVPYENYTEEDYSKTPILMIHGTVSEMHSYCGWIGFFKEIEVDDKKVQQIKEHFRFYVYRYPSNSTSLAEVKNNLTQGINELLASEKNKKIIFIVSSLGGNLLCNVLDQNPSLATATKSAITLGVPFYGVPLFNDDLKKNTLLNSALLNSTNLLYPELNDELKWSIGDKRCFSISNKLVNYGAFLDDSPIEITTGQIQHLWNAFIHQKMSYEFADQFHSEYYIQYNDGLVPLISSLRLSPIEKNQSLEFLLSEIKEQNHQARLFKGIDHTDLTHYDGRLEQMTDLLNNSSKKTVNEFIFEDLMKTVK